jgi:hypothetical protein
MERTENCLIKLDRLNKTIRHQEADRVPVSDFFWGSFISRWKNDLGLPADADPYKYYDLDMIVTIPNMDPHIREFEIIRQDDQEVVVKTGFETTIRKRFDFPMPEQVGWDTDTIEKLLAFEFDDPWDRRRYFEGGDNQIAGVGDCFYRNSPPWVDTVKELYPDIPVWGSVMECSECLTRLIGQMNNLLWIGMYPDRLGEALRRIGAFYLEICKAQVEAAGDYLDGMVIWGDIAFKQGPFFDPEYWRRHYKPWVNAMVEHCHGHDLPVMYHGCGNVNILFVDFIEMGVDLYNPLEVKAGMDAVELKKRYGKRIGFCGSNDITVWERGDREEIRRNTLRVLNAAKGGGYVFQSDHSVSSGVSGHIYDYIMKLVRQHGTYPLKLDEYDETV